MGLLIVPCHTWSNVNDENPVFDVRETKPCVGLLPDLFRRRKGVVRTLHPRIRCAFTGPGHRRLQKGRSGSIRPVRPAPVTASCCGKMRR